MEQTVHAARQSCLRLCCLLTHPRAQYSWRLLYQRFCARASLYDSPTGSLIIFKSRPVASRHFADPLYFLPASHYRGVYNSSVP